ncbi:MAG: NADH-quinone oxidoreductase subunit C [Myxococcales bacterium]|nr:NADH-quinone oxidoreductase subunit C [Myxococcales bacterium]
MPQDLGTHPQSGQPQSPQYLTDLCRAFAGVGVLGSHTAVGDATVIVERTALVALMTSLRDDARCTFDVLVDVTAVDYSEFAPLMRAATSPIDADHPSGLTSATLPALEVVYHLLSMRHCHRLRVKVPVNAEDPQVPTLCEMWPAANWGERETFDMYGVRFAGHPDLRRILTYDEFEGHPLLKDFPLRGYQPLMALPTLTEYADQETYR